MLYTVHARFLFFLVVLSFILGPIMFSISSFKSHFYWPKGYRYMSSDRYSSREHVFSPYTCFLPNRNATYLVKDIDSHIDDKICQGHHDRNSTLLYLNCNRAHESIGVEFTLWNCMFVTCPRLFFSCKSESKNAIGLVIFLMERKLSEHLSLLLCHLFPSFLALLLKDCLLPIRFAIGCFNLVVPLILVSGMTEPWNMLT